MVLGAPSFTAISKFKISTFRVSIIFFKLRFKKIVRYFKKRNVCVKLKTDEKDKIERIKKFASDNKGDGKLLFYLDDLKKITTLKGFETIDITDDTVSKLFEIAGNDNVRFTLLKGN